MDRDLYLQMSEIETEHWWFAGRREIICDTVSKLSLPRDAQILDAGCGTGGNLAMLAQFGALTAVEMDDEAAALASNKHICSVHKGMLPHGFPFTAPQFDLIVMLDVLEHIEDDHASLETLTSLLLPEGRLLITVPAFPFLWSEHDEAHHHQRRYTAATLTERITGAGFHLEKLSYYNTWLFPPVAAIRLLRRVLPARSVTADTRLPVSLLNSMLKMLFSSERHLLRHVSLPFGVSLLAVARKAAP